MKYCADGDAIDKRKSKKPSIAQAVVAALLVMGAFLALVVVSRDALSTAQPLEHHYVVTPSQNVNTNVDATQVTSVVEARATILLVQREEPEMNNFSQELVDDSSVDALPKETVALKAGVIPERSMRFCKPSFSGNEDRLLLRTQ